MEVFLCCYGSLFFSDFELPFRKQANEKNLNKEQPTYILAEKIPSNHLAVYAGVVQDTEFCFFFHYLKWHRNSKLELLSSPKLSFLYSLGIADKNSV